MTTCLRGWPATVPPTHKPRPSSPELRGPSALCGNGGHYCTFGLSTLLFRIFPRPPVHRAGLRHLFGVLARPVGQLCASTRKQVACLVSHSCGHSVILHWEGPGGAGHPATASWEKTCQRPFVEVSSRLCSSSCTWKRPGTQNAGCAMTGRSATRATSRRVPIVHHPARIFPPFPPASAAFQACPKSETLPPRSTLT